MKFQFNSKIILCCRLIKQSSITLDRNYTILQLNNSLIGNRATPSEFSKYILKMLKERKEISIEAYK